MRVVFMGTPQFAVVHLQALLDAGHEVSGVFCQPDRAQGRSPLPMAPPAKICASCHSIPVVQPRRLGEKSLGLLNDWRPDVIVVTAYGRLLPPAILSLPMYGCLNVHASLLPKYRGAAPIQWAIARGEKVTGCSIMMMDEGLDTGDVLLQQSLDIGPEDTSATLHDRLALLGSAMLVDVLARLPRGDLPRVVQRDEDATFAPPLSREDGQVDWSRSARELCDRLRGFCPWPGTHTFFRGRQLKLFPFCRARDGSPGVGPGTVLEAGRHGVVVACGTGALELADVQLEGKRRIGAVDFANGVHMQAGDCLGIE